MKHTSLHCPTRYPPIPASRKRTCRQSALPRSTTSEHIIRPSWRSNPRSLACRSPTLPLSHDTPHVRDDSLYFVNIILSVSTACSLNLFNVFFPRALWYRSIIWLNGCILHVLLSLHCTVCIYPLAVPSLNKDVTYLLTYLQQNLLW